MADVRNYPDADKKLIKKLGSRGLFDASFATPVDMSKVNLDVMGRWVDERVTELLGFEDEVVVGLVNNLLARSRDALTGQLRKLDPRDLQVQLTGFLAKQAAPFVAELWKLLLDAQEAPHGIPRAFVERKKKQLVAQRAPGGVPARRGDVRSDGGAPPVAKKEEVDDEAAARAVKKIAAAAAHAATQPIKDYTHQSARRSPSPSHSSSGSSRSARRDKPRRDKPRRSRSRSRSSGGRGAAPRRRRDSRLSSRGGEKRRSRSRSGEKRRSRSRSGEKRRSRSRSGEKRRRRRADGDGDSRGAKKKGVGFTSAVTEGDAAADGAASDRPPLPAPWRWAESRSTRGEWYCLNDKTGERRWSLPGAAGEKSSKDDAGGKDDVPKVAVRHILVKHAASRRPTSWRQAVVEISKGDARKELERIHRAVAKADDRAAEMARIAKLRSDCPSAAKGGLLKPFGAGELDKAFEAAAFLLGPGELSPIVDTDSGLHIIFRLADDDNSSADKQ
ncbi:hypothetical protein M885DRAFT_547845 [Pelagophyceae sp. CCMP2097]|nr:hypothetical protein M885DRAFT_547845 [Pelagophyceae sp. CCMP2097]